MRPYVTSSAYPLVRCPRPLAGISPTLVHCIRASAARPYVTSSAYPLVRCPCPLAHPLIRWLAFPQHWCVARSPLTKPTHREPHKGVSPLGRGFLLLIAHRPSLSPQHSALSTQHTCQRPAK